MKTIKFAAFLFYRYYQKGPTSSIPYFSTIGAMAMLLFMHLFQILILTKKVETFIPIKPTDDRLTKYIIMFFVMAPLFLLLALTIKKEELKNLKYSEAKVRTGNILLVCYIISTIIVLFTLMFLVPQG